jgi:hypothetical protein
MRSLLSDLAVFNQQDPVGITDGRQPVGDDEGSSVLADLQHCPPYFLFGHSINGTGRFIQNQDRCVGQHRPGDAQQLALALGQFHAALAQHRVISFRQLRDEAVCFRGPGGRFDLFHRRFRMSVADVLLDRLREQRRILQHDAEGGAQILHAVFAQVMAVEADAAFTHIIETRQQVDQRGLARAGRTDDGDLGAGRDVQADVLQHGLLRRIAEVHMAHDNVSARILQAESVRPVRRLRGFVQNLEDPLGAGDGGLEVVVDVGDFHKRPCELARVQQETGDQTDVTDAAVHEQDAAQYRNGQIAEIVDDIHQRHQIARPGQGADGHLAEGVVLLPEFLFHLRFASEGLDDGKAGDAFLHLAVQDAQVFLLGGEEPARMPGDDRGQKINENHAGQGDQRQQRAQAQHHDKDAEDGKAVGQQQRQRIGDGRADVVDVIGQPAHQFAVLAAVEEHQRQGLDLVKQRLADAGDHALADGRHQILLQEFHQPVAEIQETQAHEHHGDRIPGPDQGHCLAGQVRGKDGRGGAQGGQEQDDAQPAPASFGQIPQAAQGAFHILRLDDGAASAGARDPVQIRRRSHSIGHLHRLRSGTGKSPGRRGRMPAVVCGCRSPAPGRRPGTGCGLSS